MRTLPPRPRGRFFDLSRTLLSAWLLAAIAPRAVCSRSRSAAGCFQAERHGRSRDSRNGRGLYQGL
jgi:hypothetical protein